MAELKISFFKRIGQYLIYFLLFSLSCSIAGVNISIFLLYLVTLILVVKKEVVVFIPTEAKFMGLYVCITLFVSIFAINHIASLLYLRKMSRSLVIFCLAWYTWSYSREKWQRFFHVLFGVAGIIGIYGVIQYFTGITILQKGGKWYGGYDTWHGNPFLYQGNWYNASLTINNNAFIQTIWEVRGTFSHHLTFGGVFLYFTLLALSFALFSNKERKFYGSLSVLFILVIILSYARAAWLGLLIGGAVLIYYKLPKKQRKCSLLLGLGIFIVLIFLIKTKTVTHTLHKFSLGKRVVKALNLESNIDRIYMWEAALISVKKHPFLGVGANNSTSLQAIYDQLSNKYHHIFENKASVGVHNLYLQICVQFGIFALLAWLAWIGTWLWRVKEGIHKAADYEKAVLIGIFASGIGFLTMGLFENNFHDAEVQAILLTYMGISWAILHKQKIKLTLDNDKKAEV